jgi:hypothetical protein
LVCGFDASDKPHVFGVTNPGRVSIYDLTGFHAVGIGQNTAIARLLILDTDEKDKLALALYQAFDAKANAEVTQGVGYGWDAEILVPGVPAITVPREIITILENLMRSHPETPFPTKVGAKPVRWKQRLASFSKKVLARAKPSTARRSKGRR